MDSYGSHGSSSAPNESEIMHQVKSTLRMQYLQEFYQTMRDHCFRICITSPGSSLSSSEQKCLARCMDRYQDATEVITKTLLSNEGMH